MAVSADTLRLAIAKETTPGTAATGAFDMIRTVGEGLTYEVTTTQSEEMGGLNRGIKDDILTGAQVTGAINFELSKHTAFENLLAGLLASKWGADYWTAPWEGSADLSYDYKEYQTFTAEKRFTMEDNSNRWHLFVGCMVNGMTLTITPNEPITGSYTFLGNEMTTPDADQGSSYVLAGTNPIMTAPLVTGIEVLSPAGIDDTTGAPLGTPVAWAQNGCFTNLELTVSDNGRGLQCIGYLGNKETVLGSFEASASASMYYNGDEPLDALVNRDEFALRVTTTDEDGNSYQWLFPRFKISEASVLAEGRNTDVMANMTLQMLEYQGDIYANTMLVTRA